MEPGVASFSGRPRGERDGVTGRVHMTRHHALGVSSLALGAALLAAGAATAQTASSSSAEISELIVTAQRVEENIQQVPIAVTAFSSAAMQRQSIETIQDIAL